jgi:hypothetical protein
MTLAERLRRYFEDTDTVLSVLSEQMRHDLQQAADELERLYAIPEPDVKAMVDRFLCWKLPQDFGPDCGISFDGRKDDEWNKNKTWPVGTNLFTADQARQMVEHMLASDKPAERDSDA